MAGMKTKKIDIPQEVYVAQCVRACADLIQLTLDKDGLLSVEVEARCRFKNGLKLDISCVNHAMPMRNRKMKSFKKPLKAK